MAITQTRNDGDYVARFSSGAVLDTVSEQVTIPVGFQPRLFLLLTGATGARAEWYEGLVQGAKVVTAAGGAITFSATAGFTWDASTNSMKVDASLISAGVQYYWFAWA